MHETTRLIERLGSGEVSAAHELLPLVYDELRRLASQRIAREAPGQTLQATALVHEAYLRLIGKDGDRAAGQPWHGRAHFFAAAAEAMRRILVDQYRRKRAERHGGGARRSDIEENFIAAPSAEANLLAVHEALDELERHDGQAATLVKLRFFAGFDHGEAAEMMGISRRAADRLWLLARTWLFRNLREERPDAAPAP